MSAVVTLICKRYPKILDILHTNTATLSQVILMSCVLIWKESQQIWVVLQFPVVVVAINLATTKFVHPNFLSPTLLGFKNSWLAGKNGV